MQTINNYNNNDDNNNNWIFDDDNNNNINNDNENCSNIDNNIEVFKDQLKNDKEKVAEYGRTLFDQACILEGEAIKDPAGLAERITSLLEN